MSYIDIPSRKSLTKEVDILHSLIDKDRILLENQELLIQNLQGYIANHLPDYEEDLFLDEFGNTVLIL